MLTGGYPSEKMLYLIVESHQMCCLPVMFWVIASMMVVTAGVVMGLQFADRKKNLENYIVRNKFNDAQNLDYKTMRHQAIMSKFE